MQKKRRILPPLRVMRDEEVGRVRGNAKTQPVWNFVIEQAKKGPRYRFEVVRRLLAIEIHQILGIRDPQVATRKLVSSFRIAHHLSRWGESKKWALIKDKLLDILAYGHSSQSPFKRFAQHQKDLEICDEVMQACGPTWGINLQPEIDELRRIRTDSSNLEQVKKDFAECQENWPKVLRKRHGARESANSNLTVVAVHFLKRLRCKNPMATVARIRKEIGHSNLTDARSVRREYLRKKKALGTSELNRRVRAFLSAFALMP